MAILRNVDFLTQRQIIHAEWFTVAYAQSTHDIVNGIPQFILLTPLILLTPQ